MDFDDLNEDGVGQSIADTAQSMVGNGSYGLYRYSSGIPAGTPKDDAFVNTVLAGSGNDFGGKAPSLSDWTDPNSDIPGFARVSGPPQAGDVLATQTPVRMDGYSPNGQSLGIATGNGTSIGIHAGQQIAENTFGHEDGHDPIVRRVSQEAPSQQNGNAPNQDLERATTIAGGYVGGQLGARFGGPAWGLLGAIAGGLGGNYMARHTQTGRLPQIPNISQPTASPIDGVAPGDPGSKGYTD
jgi:hypothetical protein